MTDLSSVKSELALLMGIQAEDAGEYDDLVTYAVSCVSPLIKDGADENDVRIVHFCAAKAYYVLMLAQSDGISSFSAGEVSYTADSSCAERAAALLNEAAAACSGIVDCGGFAFRTV